VSGHARDTGRRDSGPSSATARLRRREVGISVPDDFPRPREQWPPWPAAGGRKVGAGRPGPLARGEGRKTLKAVASEPARRSGLVFALVCFTGSN
jgi:hypothetical protein